jgi:hypothetical protein
MRPHQMLGDNPHPPGETCPGCLRRTGVLCARCGHDRVVHCGRGHYHIEDGSCVECPTSHLDSETCNAFAAPVG